MYEHPHIFPFPVLSMWKASGKHLVSNLTHNTLRGFQDYRSAGLDFMGRLGIVNLIGNVLCNFGFFDQMISYTTGLITDVTLYSLSVNTFMVKSNLQHLNV